MLSRQKILQVVLVFVGLNSYQVSSAFWLTDNSLFTDSKLSLKEVENESPRSAQTTVIDLTDISNDLASARKESWQAAGQENSQTTSKQAEANQLASSANEFVQLQQCQCNSEWLQNQTNLWLNRWLKSANFANQVQRLLLASNSTGALNQSGVSKLQSQSGSLPTGIASHNWSLWPRGFLSSSAGGATSNAERANRTANGSGQIHANGQMHSNNRIRNQGARIARNQQQSQPKVVFGSQGPKGDQGARGERGASGLISVPDRNALFDMASPSVPANKENKAKEAEKVPGVMSTEEQAKHDQRLAFIESEQLLVVRTSSGWRPIQMLSPLRDFRRAVTKFSIQSPEERRELLIPRQRILSTVVDGINNNSIRPLKQFPLLATDVTNNHVDLADFKDLKGSPDDFYNEDADEEDDDDEDDDDDDDDTDDEDGDDQEEEDDRQGSLVDSSDLLESLRAKRKSLASGRSALASAAAAEVADTNSRLKLRLVALNEPFSGNTHGIRGADFECKRNAARANVKGSFRAFLASGFQNLNEIVRYNVHKYPIVNLRGDTLANSWHDLFRQPARLSNPLSRIYSFEGRHVASDSKWPNKLVWHGANGKLGRKDPTNNCDGWHSDSLSKFGFATPIHYHRPGAKARRPHEQPRNRRLSSERLNGTEQTGSSSEQVSVLELTEKYPCRMPLIVLCVETIGQQSGTFVKSFDKNALDQNTLPV